MKRIITPAVVAVVLVCGYAIANGLNRSGDPAPRLVLTERELALPRNMSNDNKPGVQLRLQIEHRTDPLDSRNWLSEDRLRAIGFPMHVPQGSPEADREYSRAIPRIAWVVLELDGPAWRAIDERRKLEQSPAARHGSVIDPPRLVPVDAGPDVDALRARYPTGHLILRATIVLHYMPPPRGPFVYGSIRDVHPSTITVPRHLGGELEGLGEVSGPPRYEVEMAVGRLGIPYITAIRRLNTL